MLAAPRLSFRHAALVLAPLLVVALGRSLDGREDTDALDDLERRARSGDKWDRKRAVEGLVEVGGEAAWELVLDALGDRAGEVADTAQLVLARARDPEVRERLLGADGLRARDEWRRRRAVELVGRFEDAVPTRPLLRALGDGDDEVRRMALWSLERGARGARLDVGEESDAFGEVVDAVERRVERGRDVGVRARALFALEALAPARAAPHVRAWCTARRDDARARRAAAAELVPRVVADAEAVAALRELASDAARSVRSAAVRALARLRSREALGALVERLDVETDERLVGFVVERLRAVSGLKHRGDPRPWRAWLATLPAGWRGAELAPFEPDGGWRNASAAPPGDRSVAFAGLPLLSTRVAFLIDLSGSMWRPGADGRARKEVVEEKLRGALERAPEGTRFNLIPFTARPRPWRDELVAATPRNVRAALRFFESRAERGTGNVWDAVRLALEDPEVDTLVVLTDGVPTGGRRHALELLVPLWVEADVTRRVSVDSILVGASPRVREHWARLAHATLGRSISVEL